jgi:hypothetical protein
MVFKKPWAYSTNEYGSTFKWIDAVTNRKAYTKWASFDDATKYFEPSMKEFMINYRVENIETLVEDLSKME